MKPTTQQPQEPKAKSPPTPSPDAVKQAEKKDAGAATEQGGQPKTKEDLDAIQTFVDDLIKRPAGEKKKSDRTQTREASLATKRKPAQKENDDDAGESDKTLAKPRAAKPPPDYSELKTAVAEGVREAIKSTSPKSDDGGEPEEKPFALPDEEARKLETLSRMERLFQSKYNGLSKKYEDSVRAAAKYAADWEKKNPGKAFDDNDPEHADFFEQHDVDWDDDDFNSAQMDLIADRKAEEKLKPLSAELEEIKLEKKRREHLKQVHAEQDEAAVGYWKNYDGPLANVLKEDGTLDEEAAKAARKADPIAFDLAMHYAEKVVEPVAAELYLLANGLAKFDPKNRMHAEINQFALSREKRMLERPKEEQADRAGRTFVSSDQWNKMNAEQRKNHWTYSHKQLTQLFARAKAKEAVEIANAKREEFKRYAGHFGVAGVGEPRKSGVAARRPAADEDDGVGDDDDGKPTSPSVSSAPRVSGEKAGRGADEAERLFNWATS